MIFYKEGATNQEDLWKHKDEQSLTQLNNLLKITEKVWGKSKRDTQERKRKGGWQRRREEQMLHFSGNSLFFSLARGHGGMTSLHQFSLMTVAAPLNTLLCDFFITTSWYHHLVDDDGIKWSLGIKITRENLISAQCPTHLLLGQFRKQKWKKIGEAANATKWDYEELLLTHYWTWVKKKSNSVFFLLKWFLHTIFHHMSQPLGGNNMLCNYQ